MQSDRDLVASQSGSQDLIDAADERLTLIGLDTSGSITDADITTALDTDPIVLRDDVNRPILEQNVVDGQLEFEQVTVPIEVVFNQTDFDNELLHAIMLEVDNPTREDVNFRGVNRLQIHTLAGDDAILMDDTGVNTFINLGEDDDVLVVGTVPLVPDTGNKTIEFPEGVPVADTQNMTNGNSHVTVVYAEGGDDEFEVNHNAAKLFLHGGDGDDTFVINTFIALRENPLDSDEITNLASIFGGTGSNRYEYVQNAPVFLNGGAGIDTVVVTGTPIADTFVVTENYIAGAGRIIYFTNMERIELNAAAGDDEIYILSTSTDFETSVRGGSGDDTIHLGGKHPTIVLDPPEFTYQPPAFEVQSPPTLVYDYKTAGGHRDSFFVPANQLGINVNPIPIYRTFKLFGIFSFKWIKELVGYRFNPVQQLGAALVTQHLRDKWRGFDRGLFQDILSGTPSGVDPTDPDRIAQDDARATNGLNDLISRAISAGGIKVTIVPFLGVQVSYNLPEFERRIGEEVLAPPDTVVPDPVTVDPPAFAFQAPETLISPTSREDSPLMAARSLRTVAVRVKLKAAIWVKVTI